MYKIRDMQNEDFPRVLEIYAQGFLCGANLQREVPTTGEWDNSHHKFCRLVAVNESEKVIGWVALMPTVPASRIAYSGVSEVSVYVCNGEKRHGVGTALLKKAIEKAPLSDIWTLESRIISSNIASLRAHEKAGFRIVGIRKKIAQDKNKIWQDIILVEYRCEYE